MKFKIEPLHGSGRRSRLLGLHLWTRYYRLHLQHQKQKNRQTYAAYKIALWLTAYPTNTDKALLIREYIRGILDSRVQERVVLQESDYFQISVNYASNMEAGFEYITA